MTDVEALALGLAAYAGVILIIALIAHSRRCPLCPEGVCRPCRPCARANGGAIRPDKSVDRGAVDPNGRRKEYDYRIL